MKSTSLKLAFIMQSIIVPFVPACTPIDYPLSKTTTNNPIEIPVSLKQHRRLYDLVMRMTRFPYEVYIRSRHTAEQVCLAIACLIRQEIPLLKIIGGTP